MVQMTSQSHLATRALDPKIAMECRATKRELAGPNRLSISLNASARYIECNLKSNWRSSENFNFLIGRQISQGVCIEFTFLIARGRGGGVSLRDHACKLWERKVSVHHCKQAFFHSLQHKWWIVWIQFFIPFNNFIGGLHLSVCQHSFKFVIDWTGRRNETWSARLSLRSQPVWEPEPEPEGVHVSKQCGLPRSNEMLGAEQQRSIKNWAAENSYQLIWLWNQIWAFKFASQSIRQQ